MALQAIGSRFVEWASTLFPQSKPCMRAGEEFSAGYSSSQLCASSLFRRNRGSAPLIQQYSAASGQRLPPSILPSALCLRPAQPSTGAAPTFSQRRRWTGRLCGSRCLEFIFQIVHLVHLPGFASVPALRARLGAGVELWGSV
ncbi:hypothetical protein SRHO_G00302740 [Serrasalmus rhombeus]